MKHVLLLLFAVFTFAASPASGGQVGLMEIDELNSMLESENLTILDARTGRDWSTSELKIPGAIRAASGDYATWSNTLDKGNTIVIYCA